MSTFKLTTFDAEYPKQFAGGQAILGGSTGSNSALTGGDVVGSYGDLSVVGLRSSVSLASNFTPVTLGDVLTIIQANPAVARFAAPSNSGSLSYGSNSTHVAEISSGGAATEVARYDHYHAGIAQITASSSNTLQRGTVNLRPGTAISFGLSDTDSDGEFDTLTINGQAVGGSSAPWGSGTSFPGSPSTNDRWTRTDHGLDFYYDGTRWLTTQLFIYTGLGQNGTTLNNATTGVRNFHVMPQVVSGLSAWLVWARLNFFVASPNNTTNYWKVQLKNEAGSNITNGLISTINGSSNAWNKDASTINQVLSTGLLEMAIDRTGAPGAWSGNYAVAFRLIGT